MEPARLRDALSAYWPGGQHAPACVIGISLAEAYRGTRRVVEHRGVRVPVTIPPGAHTGTKVYLPRMGGDDDRLANFCTVVVHDQPPFKRYGDDLHLEWSVDAYTTVLGGSVEIPTLTGRAKLTVPPWTAPGTTLRLEGRGMPRLGQPGAYGDLCVHLEVTMPDDASELERRLIGDILVLRGWHLGHH